MQYQTKHFLSCFVCRFFIITLLRYIVTLLTWNLCILFIFIILLYKNRNDRRVKCENSLKNYHQLATIFLDESEPDESLSFATRTTRSRAQLQSSNNDLIEKRLNCTIRKHFLRHLSLVWSCEDIWLFDGNIWIVIFISQSNRCTAMN